MPVKIILENAGITKSELYRIEKAELAGTLTLNKLKATANAMGCDLHYAVVPRGEINAIIEDKARRHAIKILNNANTHMQLEDQGTSREQHMITNENVEGATPLEPDELAGLKFKHITTRGQLDELEQANIVKGLLWLKKSIKRDDILSLTFAMDLHKALFKEVWSWAGSFRLTEKNIGIDPIYISVSLKNLLDDLSAWIESETYLPSEAVLRFHHLLVKTHPFPNGNGRFSRIYADIVSEKYFEMAPINWGGKQLDKVKEKDQVS